jgi:hypothetical protein
LSTSAIRATFCAFAVSPALASIAAQTTRPSARACDHFAREYSPRASARGQVLGGTVAEALLELGLGSIVGRARVGAGSGAGIGLIAGGGKRQVDAQGPVSI